MELIFLEPVFKEKIWGGNKLRDDLNMDVKSENIGEAWVISAQKNGVSKIYSPSKYKGMGLDELYKKNPQLFYDNCEENFINNDENFTDNKQKKFPLLIKLLDASDNLSVQVHPDDKYASLYEGENELGKTECWYIVSAEENAEIVYGHNAKTREEFINMVNDEKWDILLKRVKVKAGDFFFVPHGTIHAIGKGIVILETQQSSDTTYRVYDYDRIDSEGNKRELHIEKSMAVSNIPDKIIENVSKINTYGDNSITSFIECEYFNVYKYDCRDSLNIDLSDKYYLMTVIDGSGTVLLNEIPYEVKVSDSFIVPRGIKTFSVRGDLTIISSSA